MTTWKNVQHPQSPGKCKWKLHWDSIPVRMAIIKTTNNSKCRWGCGGKDALIHCWWEYKLVWPLWELVMRFLKILTLELPYDLVIPLQVIYSKQSKSGYRDTLTPMFIIALVTIAKWWNQLSCPSMGEWVKKMWYIYTMEFYSVINSNEIMSFLRKMDGTRDYHATKTSIICFLWFADARGKKMKQNKMNAPKKKKGHESKGGDY
jgi:hypothetical protein